MIKRILIVGFGSIGKRHLRIVRESLPDAEIMVMRHKCGDQIPDHANFITTSIQDSIKFSPEVAILANPASFHIEVASELANIGCHLLIEKPISDKINGIEKFLSKVNQLGLICQVGYNLRFLESLQKFRELIIKNVVGRPLSIRCEVGQYLPGWRTESDYRQGVSAKKELGGGVLLELSHEIDYLYWIFGDVSWVSAWIGKVSNLDIDVEDLAHIILGFKKANKEKDLVASICMDFVRADTTRTCTVIGEDGSLRWNGLSGDIDIFRHGENDWSEYIKTPHIIDDSYRAQWTNFMNAVNKVDKPMVDAAKAFYVLKVIDRIKSSALGNTI